MTTKNENEAGVNPAIDEATVAAWLKDQAASYGIAGLVLKIEGNEDDMCPCIAVLRGGDYGFGCGGTFREAVTMLCRARAAQLMAKADALSPQEVQP
jgi:hypothetical protein